MLNLLLYLPITKDRIFMQIHIYNHYICMQIYTYSGKNMWEKNTKYAT